MKLFRLILIAFLAIGIVGQAELSSAQMSTAVQFCSSISTSCSGGGSYIELNTYSTFILYSNDLYANQVNISGTQAYFYSASLGSTSASIETFGLTVSAGNVTITNLGTTTITFTTSGTTTVLVSTPNEASATINGNQALVPYLNGGLQLNSIASGATVVITTNTYICVGNSASATIVSLQILLPLAIGFIFPIAILAGFETVFIGIRNENQTTKTRLGYIAALFVLPVGMTLFVYALSFVIPPALMTLSGATVC